MCMCVCACARVHECVHECVHWCVGKRGTAPQSRICLAMSFGYPPGGGGAPVPLMQPNLLEVTGTDYLTYL